MIHDYDTTSKAQMNSMQSSYIYQQKRTSKFCGTPGKEKKQNNKKKQTRKNKQEKKKPKKQLTKKTKNNKRVQLIYLQSNPIILCDFIKVMTKPLFSSNINILGCVITLQNHSTFQCLVVGLPSVRGQMVHACCWWCLQIHAGPHGNIKSLHVSWWTLDIF